MKHLSTSPSTRPLRLRLTLAGLVGIAIAAFPASRAFAEPERAAAVD
jgi:hypothetical protein